MRPITIEQSVPAFSSYRAARVRSLFNVTPDAGRSFSARAELPVDETDWSVGLIVGPSGSGKSSIGRACWPGAFHEGFSWSQQPIIDDIGGRVSFDQVAGALSAVGLGSVPSWLRPFSVLSTGEKFRAELARILVDGPQRIVVDEFTSVVDRRIAQVGAAAFSKAWRREKGRQVILLSCHRDIVEWVQPDWILDTEDYSFSRGCLQRRPAVEFEVFQTDWKPWRKTFEPHHYLKLPLMIGATCYVAVYQGEPVAHVAVATNTGLRSARMCRLVVLPEWQGIGIGTRFVDHVADMWLRGRNRYGIPMTTLFHTSHPGLSAALRRNRSWLFHDGRVLGESGFKSWSTLAASARARGDSYGHHRFGGHMRAVQTFRYVGNEAA